MAIYKLGLDCVLTFGGTQVKNAKDVTLTVERGDADVTTRNAAGWRSHMGTLKDATISFELLTGGPDFTAMLAAFTGRAKTSVSVSGGAISFSATMVVTGFAASQPLENAESVSVTLRPSIGTTPSFSVSANA